MGSASNIAEDIGTGGIASAFNGDLSDAFGDIYSHIPGVSDTRNAEAQYQQATAALIDRLEKEWKLPDYDKTPLTPQEFKLLANYAPQVAAYVQQAQPELLKNIQGPGQQAQQQSLAGLQQLASSGVDTGTKAAYELANMNADQALRSSRANAINLLNQRGLGSTGATLGADIAAGLGAAEQQRKASLQEAADASERKAQAIQALGNLGTQMAGQQQQEQEFNANTLNQYNQLLANRRQQYNQYAAETANQAQMYNQQMAQQTANQNTALNNQFNMYNQQRADEIARSLANANNQKYMTEAGLQSGANQQAANFGMQQGQNETGLFMNLVGAGVSAFGPKLMGGMGGAGAAGAAGAASSPESSTFVSPYAGSNYSFGDNYGSGMGANSFGPSDSSVY